MNVKRIILILTDSLSKTRSCSLHHKCTGENRTVVVEVLGKMGEDEVVGIKGDC